MKKVAVFFANGFEEVESITVVDYLRRAGVHTDMISTTGDKICTGSHDIKITMDMFIHEITDDYDAYVIPGGINNTLSMKKNKKLLEIIKKADDNKKFVCSICAGPTVLYEAGILKDRNITSYPGVFKNGESGFNYIENKVVVDNNIITSRGPSLTVFFVLEIIEMLKGEEVRHQIEKQILLEMM